MKRLFPVICLFFCVIAAHSFAESATRNAVPSVTETVATKAPAQTPGTWEATGSMATGRYFHTGTLLPNGRVLIAGGRNLNGFLSLVELYDPATGLWAETGSMATARSSHTATLLPNGKVLVAGGAEEAEGSAELYDPATGLWAETGSMAKPRAGHTATLLRNGTVLVAGGRRGASGWGYYDASAELYDPATGLWTATDSMGANRAYYTAMLLPNGQVLVAGGQNASEEFASAELYDPATRLWSATGSMATARSYATATLLPNGQVLVAGGFNRFSGALASAELYDPATGLWSATGSMHTARDLHTATLLPNGQVLVAGGAGYAAYFASAELYDPATGLWSTTDSMATARYGHTATLLLNGQVLAAGGFNGNYLTSAELYQPPIGAIELASAASVQRGFAIALPLSGPSGVEDRSGGPTKSYTVVMTFNQNIITVGSASSMCGDVQSVVIDSSDPHKVNINLVNGAHGCNGSTVTVTAESIADDQGNVLDSASVGLGLLLGDVNGDRVVDGQDVNMAKQFTHERVNSQNFRADVSNDGVITNSDKHLIHQQLGTSLP